ncbi:MAG: hypothetical protein ACI4GX_08040 [Ruminococcus sp.]
MAEITMQELLENRICEKEELYRKHFSGNFSETILMVNEEVNIALTVDETHNRYCLYCRTSSALLTYRAMLVRTFGDKEKAIAAFNALTV